MEEGANHRWASWDNDNSFWLMKGALLDLISNSGFDLTFDN